MISIYDVLKASKGVHVDDTFAELWGRKLSNAYTVAAYTGTLPATLQTVKGYLESYKIYGKTVQEGTPTPENPIAPSGCGERTENLFEVKSDMLSSLNWALNPGIAGTIYFINYKLSDAMTQKLKSGQYTCSIFSHFTDGYTPNLLVCAFVPTITATVGQEYRILTNQGGTFARTFDFSKWQNIYLTIGYGDGFSTEQVKQTKIDELFTNWRISIIAGSTALPYEPYGYKLPLTANGVEHPIYIGSATLAKDEYVDSATGKIYRRTKNLSPPEEEWVDEWIWGDGTVHPSTEIKTSPFIDVSTCETCIMEVFSTETEWAAAGYREMAFYDADKQYLGWIGGGGRRALTPNSSERLSEFPAGTVYVRIGCSHNNQPFYPQLVSGYTPVHQLYPYIVPTDPPAPLPQIPTFAGITTISWAGEGLAPSEVELTYRKPKGQ